MARLLFLDPRTIVKCSEDMVSRTLVKEDRDLDHKTGPIAFLDLIRQPVLNRLHPDTNVAIHLNSWMAFKFWDIKTEFGPGFYLQD